MLCLCSVVFCRARKTTLFSKEWTNILHPFQGNSHKGRLHCGLRKSNCLLKNTLSQWCYIFCKKHYTSSNGNSMHCVFVQQLKSHHTQPYSFTRTAVCLEGYFLKGMLHTFERNIACNCVYIYVYIYRVNNIIQWIMLFENYIVFSKWIIFVRTNIVV